MHPDLSPHLHIEECNIIIEQYKKCTKENPFKQAFGACDALYSSMGKCLKREREEMRAINAKKAKEHQERVLKRMSETN